ncbi:MAG: hypothetical protein SO434_02700 [Eubacteriales bacterium]|nr:hypothetical protein [Eubacteriales bacterium]
MKKTVVAILICLIVVLTIGLAGCSQGVDKLFGKQDKVSYSLQEVTGLNVNKSAYIEDSDEFGLATFRYYNTLDGKTYYSLFNFETSTMIVTDSTLEIIQISDGLYAQINTESKYILYGKDGLIASGLEGTIIGNEFYDKNSETTYYIGMDGLLKKSQSPFEERLRYGELIQIGDYQAKPVDNGNNYGFKFYNQKGKYVGEFFPQVDLNVSLEAEANAIWLIGNKFFCQYLTLSYADNDKFDLFIEGKKYDINTYCYDVKSGKSKKVKFNYYVQATQELYDDSVILKISDIVDKGLTASYVQSFGLDAVGNITVKVDLQKMLKGATSAKEYCGADGKQQLLLSNATDSCLYEGNKCIVKFAKNINATINSDTVKVNNKIYTLSGKLIINIADVNSYKYTDDGKLAYSMQDKDDTDKTRYYIYDIVNDNTREITAGIGESVTFSDNYYKVGDKVYFYVLESQAIDNVQSINAVYYYFASEKSYKKVYKVITTDGNAKYYVYNEYVK